MKIRKIYLSVWTILIVVLVACTLIMYPKDKYYIKQTFVDTYDYAYAVGQKFYTNFSDEITGYRKSIKDSLGTDSTEYKQLVNYTEVIETTKGVFEFFISEIENFDYGYTYFRTNHEFLNAINEFNDQLESMNDYAEKCLLDANGSSDWLRISWTSMKDYMKTSISDLSTLVKDIHILYTDCGKVTVQKNEFTLEVLNQIGIYIGNINNLRLCDNVDSTSSVTINVYSDLIKNYLGEDRLYNSIYNYVSSDELKNKFKNYLTTLDISLLLSIY